MPSILNVPQGTLGQIARMSFYSENTAAFYKVAYDCNGRTIHSEYKPSMEGEFWVDIPLDYGLASSYPNGKYGAVTIRVTRHSSPNCTAADQVGGATTASLQYVIPEDGKTKPTISKAMFSPQPVKFGGAYIQVTNGIQKDSVTASGKYGATIQKTYFRCEGKQYDSVSAAFLQNGESTIFAYAVDSRGFTSDPYRVVVNVIAYYTPMLKRVSAARCNADGKVNVKGAYLKLSATRDYAPVIYGGSQKNFCQIAYRYKANDGSWSGWSEILAGSASGNTVNTGLLLGTLNASKTYTVELRATDTLGNQTTVSMGTENARIYWHRDGKRGSFRFGGLCTKDNAFTIGDDFELEVLGTLNLGAEAQQTIGKIVYPVGSIYLSVNATSPASLLGGSWALLKDRFLLGAGDTYTAGKTGGASTHTLTVNEMPKHSHGIRAAAAQYDIREDATTGGGSSQVWPISQQENASNTWFIHETGGGNAHSIMPPYLVVYMWKRIS